MDEDRKRSALEMSPEERKATMADIIRRVQEDIRRETNETVQ